ncbi:MAG: tyrosine-type recombinase/integrase, partial [Candidatus Aenigmatarchaeota archaeon]
MMQETGGSPIKDVAGYLPRDKIKLIINAAVDNRRDYVLLNTLALSGRRISEIVGLREGKDEYGKYKRLDEPLGGLRPADLLEGNSVAWMILKKRNRQRVVKAIPARLRRLLGNYIASREIPMDALVFPITARRVDQIIKKYAEKVGISRVGSRQMGCHVFRHSYAISLIDK